MRIAAGTLMVILGLTIMCRYVDVLGKNDVYSELPFTIFVLLSSSFVIAAGFFVLRDSIG